MRNSPVKVLSVKKVQISYFMRYASHQYGHLEKIADKERVLLITQWGHPYVAIVPAALVPAAIHFTQAERRFSQMNYDELVCALASFFAIKMSANNKRHNLSDFIGHLAGKPKPDPAQRFKPTPPLANAP
jgi:hypothetical protein